ncbi:MAG TPA: carboxypeptidase-like regulatory domain-containing protein, partial [Candidatus Acidoferrum sp.]|nr:carboxypeptidase-like regulatory domain-containing protein [Candidatus Acidoferrum sp.]
MFARLFLLVPLTAPLMAQQTTATVLGAVTDASGASVAGVAIQASSLATNVTRETLTDNNGAYSLPNLPPGSYRISATKTGFQASRVENVTLQVEQVARLDIKLQVGSITETINVDASVALLQTETSSVGTVIDAGKIVDLPLNGRNFIQLAQLIPGVQ